MWIAVVGTIVSLGLAESNTTTMAMPMNATTDSMSMSNTTTQMPMQITTDDMETDPMQTDTEPMQPGTDPMQNTTIRTTMMQQQTTESEPVRCTV